MANIDEIVKEIETLSILEVSELVSALEDKFGVSAAAPVAVAAGVVGADDPTGEGAAEEKDEYTVVLAEVGDNKINVIKAIRSINPDLGLKEAKELTDNTPGNIAENVATEKANEMKQALEDAGATVELK